MTFTPKVKKVEKNNREQIKLAFSLAKEKRFEEALSEFEAILQTDPKAKAAHMGAGNMLARQQRYDEALAHFKALMKLDPLMVQAPIAAGKVYIRQGELELARSEFQTALDIDTKCIPAFQGLARVALAQKNYELALEQLRNALRLDPQRTSARVLMARIYRQQGKLDAALSELDRAKNRDPQKWRIHQTLGRIYLDQQNYKAALAAFSEAISLNSEPPTATRLGLVEALIENNELEQARETLSQVSPTKQIAPKLHKFWGDIYQRQGLLKEAAEEYQAATLLASEAGEDPTENFEDLDAILEEDEQKWLEVVAAYGAAAKQQVQEAQNRQRENLRERRASRLNAN